MERCWDRVCWAIEEHAWRFDVTERSGYGGANPKTVFEADSLLDELKKTRAEQALNVEMDHHLANEEAGI